ncbi:MAG: response regulator, partial [Candidatus Cloacimonetes bacterium]|nr:response regulator [Candidatus Cloacimonadota bacterium]
VIKNAKTGAESLDILEKERFDLLILDINLPDVDGFTILEKMHIKLHPLWIHKYPLNSQMSIQRFGRSNSQSRSTLRSGSAS